MAEARTILAILVLIAVPSDAARADGRVAAAAGHAEGQRYAGTAAVLPVAQAPSSGNPHLTTAFATPGTPGVLPTAIFSSGFEPGETGQ